MKAVRASARIAHFRLIERLGRGGMAEVWRAHDNRLGRDVALKLLGDAVADSPRRRARFEQEARALAALAHPNIVTIHAIDEVDGRFFLTMELVEGQPLDEVLRSGPLSLARFLDISLPIAEALAAAHERGVVHGDLKPANVMIGQSGVVKIVDFGLALLFEPQASADPGELSTQDLRPADSVAGTLPYMAPELLRGRGPDPRADIFALGTMLYEMATGQRPFGGGSTLETVAAILRDEPVAPSAVSPTLPEGLDPVILRTLAKDPLRRTRRALEIADALRAIGLDGHRGTRSVAVLPFTSLSPGADQQYFCDGIAEEITAALAKVRGLRVASRASSFAVAGLGLDSREVCERLGVDTVLDGTLRRQDDELRVQVELVDGRDGCQLWSRTYERELRDVFAIQEKIADSVVRELEVTLSPYERRALRQVATHDVQAYDYYLRGRRFYHQFRRRGMEFALRMYSRAIDVDPTYARAYAGIAQCCAFLYLTFDRDDRHRERAEKTSRRALALDPQLPEAHAARGLALSLAGRQAEAERAFETAVRLDSEMFEVHYSWARLAFAQGDAERAIELYERASELRPDDFESPLLVSQIYDDLNRPDNATAARRRGVEVVRRRLDLFPDDVRALYMGANGLVGLGEREQGLDWAHQARALEPDEPLTLYNLACIFTMAGEASSALECLEHAVDLGFADRAWLEHDSNLDGLRSDSRFTALLARLPTSV